MYCNIKTYQIRYTDVDFCDRLKLSSLLAMLEESACASAEELGFGYSVLQPQKLGFVIVNWYVKLDRAITLGEELTVHTWPIKPKKLIVFRDFEIYVGDEKVGAATSRWCVVDLKSFSVVASSTVFDESMTFNAFRSVDVSNWKIPSFDGGIPSYSKKITYSDYDHYNHVNNTKYADLLLDALTLEELKDKYISLVQITYQTQCKIDEVIDFYKYIIDGAFYIEGKVCGDIRVQMRAELR